MLLLTIHILHISSPHLTQSIIEQPVPPKVESDESLDHPKQHDRPPKQPDIAVPNPDYAARVTYGREPATPPTDKDVHVPSPEEAAKLTFGDRKPRPAKPDMVRIAPANATAWHKDRNLWRAADARAQG